MQRRRNWMIAISVAATWVFLSVGCQSTAKKTPPPATEETFVEEREVEEVVEVEVPELRTIYFDFDKSDIRNDQREILRENARTIGENRQMGTITLQGHTDERGTEEYNLALGERRALSVKRYLTDLGIPATRLVTVSFGESKPAVIGHDESAWRWNRRVDFAVPR